MARRPPKPQYRRPRLAWVLERGVWRPYHRATWTDATGKQRERRVRLAYDGDLRKLDEEWWRAEAGLHPKQQPAAPKRTWADLVEAWRTDPRVQGRLSAGTKRQYRTDMDAVLEKNAGKPVKDATRQGVRAIHGALKATPRKADRIVGVMRMLWNYGRDELDWPLGENPAARIQPYGRQREYEPWPDWMLRAVDRCDDDGLRTAVKLILNTGQRPGAAIMMEWAHVLGDGYLSVLDEKRDERFEIFAHPALAEHLAGLGRGGDHILARNLREPLGYDAIEKRFRKWRAGIGAKAAAYSLHGLRKNAIITLAEAGCSDAQIQAVTNQSTAMVEYYRRKASRRRLSRDAQEQRK